MRLTMKITRNHIAGDVQRAGFFRTALAFLAVCCAPLDLISQTHPLRFERLSLEQGVAHNLVYAIHQDRQGFMWFGTMYGLVKYDGRRYTTFKHDPTDSNSISYNDVIAMHEDRAGNLWIGTWGGGLNRFDPATEKFTRFVHDSKDSTSLGENTVWAICEDHTGTLWIGHNIGLDRLPAAALQTSNAKLEHFRFQTPSESTRHASVRAIFEDSQARLWLGTIGAGLVEVLRGQDSVHFVFTKNIPDDSTSLAGNNVTAIYEDGRSNLWFGTNAGLHQLKPPANGSAALAFRRWQNTPSVATSLSSNHVEQIVEDRKGNLWVGTAQGLNRLDSARQNFERIGARPDDPTSLSSNSIVAMCRDRAGILWVGTYYGGVHKLDPHGARFGQIRFEAGEQNGLRHPNVQAIHQSRDGTLWLGTPGGLTAISNLDNPAQKFTHYRRDPNNKNSLSSNAVTSLGEDRDGILWIGTRNAGLNAFDLQHERFQHYRADVRAPNGLSSDAVSFIYEDHEGVLWIGTEGAGLNRLDRARKNFTRFQFDPKRTGSLSNDFIHVIYEDRSGTLWVGTYRGLNRFDRQTQTFQCYRHVLDDPRSLSNDYVYSLYEDGSGNFYVGTSDGLNLFDRATGKCKTYFEKNGLPNGVICGILEDEAGRLWLSTLKGLSAFDLQSETFKNFDANDGLLSNVFNAGACFKNAKGEMYFGSVNGGLYFRPEDLRRDMFVPPVVITAVNIFDQPRAFAGANALQLRHSENFLRFEFAALSYSHPEKNEFAYRLEGLEKEWIAAGTRDFASYTDLQPGHYVFRVKAANHDGVWNQEGASLAIVIAPPFWRTWWFYGLMLAAIAALLFTLHRARMKRERRRVVEIEKVRHEERFKRFQAVAQAREEERERVRKKIAADFHDESGHKLTKIALFCGVLQSKLKGRFVEVEEYLERIMKMAGSLHKDMSDFIWSLDPDEDTLHDTALKLKDFGDKLFDHTDIHFRLEGLAPELEQAHLPMETRQNLTCIFKEGMNNILKHSRASCRNVVFALSRNNGTYAVKLRDDGQGFDLEHCTPGRGLRNMQERARVIGGELRIVSTPGRGTEIQFVGKVSQANAGVLESWRDERNDALVMQ